MTYLIFLIITTIILVMFLNKARKIAFYLNLFDEPDKSNL